MRWCAATIAAAMLAGCVTPGEVTPSLISRYQQAMAERSPQQRMTESGMGMLRPNGAVGPDVLIEPVMPGKVETVTRVTYRKVGQVTRDDRLYNRVKVTTTQIRTTTMYSQYDPQADKGVPLDRRIETDETEEVRLMLAQAGLPDQSETVTTRRVRLGRETWNRTSLESTEAIVNLSLDEAIMLALLNSLDIRVVSYEPAIARQQMIQAAAEFDYVLFGGYTRRRVDEQTTTAFISSESDERNFQVGVMNKTITGAEWQASYNLTRTWDNSAFTALATRWEPTFNVELTQPLLRNAWPKFNLANLRVARINHRISLANFRQTSEDTVTQVITTYWRLVQARRDLEILVRLLENTTETYDRVLERRQIDATDVEIKQSEAAVETRRAAVFRAAKVIRDTEDSLARLLADPRINLLSRYEIVPTTSLTETPVKVDVGDQLMAALRHNPVLEQARLAVEAAAVNVTIARNQALPRLDFTFSASVQGLEEDLHEARESMQTGDFVSYSYGITGEYPIGNRERLAEVRRRRLERLRSVTDLQNTADQVAQLVKERIRQIDTAQLELEAQTAAEQAAVAETEALKVLVTTRAMQPELLQLELNSLASLANARRARVAAAADYNIALAELNRATGTVYELHGVEMALPAAIDAEPGRRGLKLVEPTEPLDALPPSEPAGTTLDAVDVRADTPAQWREIHPGELPTWEPKTPETPAPGDASAPSPPPVDVKVQAAPDEAPDGPATPLSDLADERIETGNGDGD